MTKNPQTNKHIQIPHSMFEWKAELRRRNTPPHASVLDLFCGEGRIYRQVYQGKVDYYHGVDKNKIHSPELCTRTDNLKFIAENDLDKFNVFDLDDYGSPWKQLYAIIRKLNRPCATFFITDSLVIRQKMNCRITRWESMVERLPLGFYVPGLHRWYVEIFKTMLYRIEMRYGWKIESATRFCNDGKSVYYWCLKMKNLKYQTEKEREIET